ncbi:N-acetylmuramic acid 6-phosphate etherase [Microbacterium betulae]|uniref:N-acetylmuramic acid 6-phosphate etherase n=1 Tax=Microbacterium betulae TaxID=2981139 RepID=A0AA97I527_9MICO|nr:N-acetylmuramic acid 6-phosphate etherase [Microbacterium sp. AB]WOF22379.1 N-acetylmuramic acid 6-phosphate etherase [Microbacterium sp. AB]
MTTPASASALPATERRNPASERLDELDTLDLLQTLNDADAEVSVAVRAALPALAELVDVAVRALERGGRVHYFGAGTSGRLAVLDAAELIPTFNLPPDVFVAHLAGGDDAMHRAIEGSEDSARDGAAEAAQIGDDDVVVGIAASGTTPYVRGALDAARARGAATGLITSNPDIDRRLVDIAVVADTGPEVLTGSTRLKAGTAAKMTLNAFSTAVMVRRGYTWSNLMVSVVATNRKLRERSVRILAEAAGLEPGAAQERLRAAEGDLKAALVSELGGVPLHIARQALADASGIVRRALDSLIPTERSASPN